MLDPSTIPADLAKVVREQGGADIVVGLPSHNHASTLAGVADVICQGVRETFPGRKALLVHTDSGSSDGSAQVIAERAARHGMGLVQATTQAEHPHTPYHGIPGKAEGLHLTLRIAKLAGARACMLWSPDITSASPEWIGMLCRQVVEHDFDLAVPLYARHKFDGGMTNAVVRPLVRSLYGRYMRQPMGGEYVLSAALFDRYLSQNVWGTDLVRLGSDLWTATQAICGGFKLCQVHLGAKLQPPASNPPDLGTTVSQVLGVLFEDMTRNAAAWQKVRGAQPIPTFGMADNSAPASVSFDVRKLTEAFRLGCRNLYDLWALVLPPATLLDLRRLSQMPPESFTLPDDLWCRTVFDFALGYRMRALSRSHLFGAFVPLYLAWLASFAREMQTATNAESEQRLERLCQTYEAQKPYLISRWRSPDRFNP